MKLAVKVFSNDKANENQITGAQDEFLNVFTRQKLLILCGINFTMENIDI
jgi:hypothetical protein